VRPGTRRLFAAILVMCVGSLALPASAASIDDPPLARGPLDLRRLVATKHDATAPIHVTVVTYGEWNANLLNISGSKRIFVLFNPDRLGRPDYTGEVRFNDGVSCGSGSRTAPGISSAACARTIRILTS
jgi:hypothetical protein